jgi:hypothetical protein
MATLRSIAAQIALSKIDLPEGGLEPGAFEVTLTPPAGDPVVKTTNQTSVTFDGLPPGSYKVSACRLAVTGERLSDPVESTIEIPETPPEQIDVPSSITLSLV